MYFGMHNLCDLTIFNAFLLVPALCSVYKYEKYRHYGQKPKRLKMPLTHAKLSENAPHTCQTALKCPSHMPNCLKKPLIYACLKIYSHL